VRRAGGTRATDSLDIPGTVESYQPTNHGKKDAFVASFQLRHGRRVRATYFGDSSDDESDGGDVKLDRDGNVWLVGTTYSEDLPTRKGSHLILISRRGATYRRDS
jgi:hypothetical protein